MLAGAVETRAFLKAILSQTSSESSRARRSGHHQAAVDPSAVVVESQQQKRPVVLITLSKESIFGLKEDPRASARFLPGSKKTRMEFTINSQAESGLWVGWED